MNQQTPTDSGGRDTTRKIMLVDDNLDVRTVITIGLEQLGYEVVACVDGRDAVDRFSVELPSVIIIDQGLPDIQGTEVGRQIRQLAGDHPVSIALLTGSDGPSLRQQADDAGFDGFLVKPVRIMHLSEWINQQFKRFDDAT